MMTSPRSFQWLIQREQLNGEKDEKWDGKLSYLSVVVFVLFCFLVELYLNIRTVSKATLGGSERRDGAHLAFFRAHNYTILNWNYTILNWTELNWTSTLLFNSRTQQRRIPFDIHTTVVNYDPTVKDMRRKRESRVVYL